MGFTQRECQEALAMRLLVAKTTTLVATYIGVPLRTLKDASATAAAVAAVTVASGPLGPSSVVRGVLARCA